MFIYGKRHLKDLASVSNIYLIGFEDVVSDIRRHGYSVQRFYDIILSHHHSSFSVHFERMSRKNDPYSSDDEAALHKHFQFVLEDAYVCLIHLLSPFAIRCSLNHNSHNSILVYCTVSSHFRDCYLMQMQEMQHLPGFWGNKKDCVALV